jgi:hypothetical protein
MMKKQMIFMAAMVLVASTAFAGMGSGGGMGGNGNDNGMPGRPGNSGGMGAGMGPGAATITVADDGTVLTVRRTAGDPEVPGSGTIELVAISPTGGILWTWSASGAIHALEVSGSTVLVSSTDGLLTGTPGTPGSGEQASSILHALALSSGAELWALELDGRLMSLEPSANVIYAIVVSHDWTEGTEIVPRGGMNGPGAGMGTGEIELVAISYQGVVSWTISLNP